MELEAGIATEVQVVYLLAGIRKLIERDKLEDRYADLKFHCDWALHSRMDRAAAKAILKLFDAAYPHFRGNVKVHDLPAPLGSKIDRIFQMRSFKEELSKFLAAYGLPPLTQHRPDGWTHFLHLYGKVIEDIPLVVSVPAAQRGPKHISHVTVNCETARETVKHATGEEILFKVTWTMHDKNGQWGAIFVINSFSDNSISSLEKGTP
ncbi:MAG: hypothetical protein HYT99_08695 [Candidatus Tectomicrobia bacterium]|nr:hypothetical protein [Candidatus Tectomicrobia bacterium]MBI2177743.1 hypothetical protein [Candidatus Tectomicrobia bacterium]